MTVESGAGCGGPVGQTLMGSEGGKKAGSKAEGGRALGRVRQPRMGRAIRASDERGRGLGEGADIGV